MSSKRSVYLAAAGLLLVAGVVVYPRGDDRLVGTWTLDPELLFELEQFRDFTDDQKEATRMLLTAFRMELTFTRRQVRFESNFGGKVQTREGSYRLEEGDGGALTLSLKTDDGWKDQQIEVKGDTMVIHHLGKRLPLRRKQK